LWVVTIGGIGYSLAVRPNASQDGGNISVSKPVQVPSTNPTPALPIQVQRVERTWPNKYQFKEHSLTTTVAGAEVEAEYPQIPGPAHPRVRKFNRWIRAKVLGYVAQFKRVARINNRHGRLVEMGLDLSSKVFYSNDNLISMRLTHRLMEAGQTHPINYYETLNYDLNLNRPLRAKDVFKKGYLRVLSKYSRKWLSEHYPIQGEFQEGTTPKVSNFTNWNLVSDGIFLSFEDYQVGPHSFGQPEFTVPYAELKKVLKPTKRWEGCCGETARR